MKQIGNLAVVCARRQDVLLQVGSEKVCVHVGAGPERNTLHAAWDDDDAIQRIVHELNFGRYAAGRNGLHISLKMTCMRACCSTSNGRRAELERLLR